MLPTLIILKKYLSLPLFALAIWCNLQFIPAGTSLADKVKLMKNSNQLEQALDIVNAMISENQSDLDLINQRGDIYLKLNEPDMAFRDFSHVLIEQKNHVQARLGLAKVKAYQYQVDAAYYHLQKAKDILNSDNDWYYFLIAKGEVDLQLNQIFDAERSLFEALEHSSSDFHLFELLAQCLARQKDNEAGFEYLLMVSNENDMNATTLTHLGYVMNNIERYADANVFLEQAMNMDPENAEALCHMGFTYLKLGKYKEGLKKVEQSIKKDPLNPHSYRIRGEILGEMEKYGKACQDFQRAISLDYPIQQQEELIELSDRFCNN